ncbi:hypothetical protein [Marinobacter halotolerans]|uniref:hypothetical protein n=1 Tax=Marinobacter halotolerans TaxID=1569211 RepID=UPI0012468CD1|nr:hypothetical protein [Marinobacter halotolerans]
MKTISLFTIRVLTIIAVCFSLAACDWFDGDNDNSATTTGDETSTGGGGDNGSGDDGDGGGDGGTVSDAPAAPVVTPSYDDWTLTFTWPDVAEATSYRVFEDPDGVSGFSRIGPDLTTNEYVNNISLTERNGARYVVAACNSAGCTDSDEVTLDGLDSGITAVVVSGDTAPGIGGGAVFNDAVGTQLRFDTNRLGTIAFLGSTDQTDSSGSLRDGVFRQSAGSGVELVQADDTTLPSSDASYNGFLEVLAADSDQIIFSGILNRQSAGSSTDDVDGLNNEVLLRNTAGVTGLIAREGEPRRGGTSFPTMDAGDIYFTENIQGNRLFGSLSIDGAGGVTFKPGSNTDGFEVVDDSPYSVGGAFWTITGAGQKEQSLRRAVTDLPGNLEPNFFGSKEYDQNPAGQLAFGLAVRNADGTSLPDSSNSGVYVRSAGGTFTEAVRETGSSARDSIDDLGSATVRITDNGEVFYLAQRDVSSFGFRGLYTNSVDNSDFTKVVRTDQLFLLEDGSTMEITDFIGGGGAFDVGANDKVAFLANAGAVSDEDTLLFWTNDGTNTSIQRYFAEGDPVRGLPDASSVDLDVPSVSPAPRLKLSRDDWAAFQASDESDSSNPRRILLATSPAGYTRLIVREQQQFAVDGVEYGEVTEILDYKMASAVELVISLRFDRDGIYGLQPDGTFVPSDGKNGIFRVNLCSADEPC